MVDGERAWPRGAMRSGRELYYIVLIGNSGGHAGGVETGRSPWQAGAGAVQWQDAGRGRYAIY